MKMLKKTFLCLIILACIFFQIACQDFVACPDGSGCRRGQHCCERFDGDFSCCSNTQRCSPGGERCLSYLSEGFIQSYNNESHLATLPLKKNAIAGAFIVLDSFLNTTNFYSYAQETALCKNDGINFGFSIKEIIEVLKDQELRKDFTKFIAVISSKVSNTIYLLRIELSDCQQVPAELKIAFEEGIKYISQEGYLFKVIQHIESKIFAIGKLAQQAVDSWNAENYQECGNSLGLLFNLIFIVN
jgi:hypothetical protein